MLFRDEVELRVATVAETTQVLGVLDDAAARLRARAIRQWPQAFQPSWVLPDIEAGRTWLAWRGHVPIATVTIGWSDPLWPDDDLAGYVHRLARTGAAPGVGEWLLEWADEQVCARDRRCLRLDCVASNAALRAYYTSRGFRHHGDATVSGPPGGRNAGGAKTVVSRYERNAVRRHE